MHDAVRPFVDVATIERVIVEARNTGAAIVGIVPVDTVKLVHLNKIRQTLTRERLILTQTPQVFRYDLLRAGVRESPRRRIHRHRRVQPGGAAGAGRSQRRRRQRTQHQDHSSDRHGIGAPVSLSGDRRTQGVLTWTFARASAGTITALLRDGRLILGGVRIESEIGLEGHSDADVLSHAITDAILGAAALGDIGMHFPDTDPRWKGADSLQFLKHACELARAEGYRISNIDSTVILERPKLKDYRAGIRERLAKQTGVARAGLREIQDQRKGRTGWRRPVGRSAGDRDTGSRLMAKTLSQCEAEFECIRKAVAGAWPAAKLDASASPMLAMPN